MRHRHLVLIAVVLAWAAECGSHRGLGQELVFPRQFMLNGPWAHAIGTMKELKEFTDKSPDSEVCLVIRNTDELPALLAACVERKMPRISIGFPKRYKPNASDLDPILVNNPHLRDLELNSFDTTFGFGGNPRQDFSRLTHLEISSTVLDEKMARQIAAFPALQSLSLRGSKVTEPVVAELLKSRTIRTLDLVRAQSVGEATGMAFASIPEDCPIVNLRLDSCNLSENAIRSLIELPHLQALDTHIKGDGRELAEALRSLKELRELHLAFPMDSAEKYELLFESIGTLENLEILTFEDLNLFSEAFGNVAKLPKLTFLSISPPGDTPVGIDETLDLIGEMSQIKSLALSGRWMDDTRIERLDDMVALENLRIAFTRVSFTGLRHLANQHKLQSLDFRWTKLTPECVEVLKTMDSLKDLRVTYITEQQSAELNAAIPECRINALSGGE